MSSRRSSTISASSMTDFEPMEGVETTRATGNPQSPDSNSPTDFFDLPREIRDRIYSLCLTAEQGYSVEWPHLPGSNPRYGLQPQLLRVCKVIHDEAAPLLYTDNSLIFHHPSDANMLVRALASPKYAKYIAHLNLHIKAQDTRLWMSYLTSTDEKRSLKKDFPQLKELVVRFRSNRWNHAATPDANMKAWSEDSRLDEIIRGLRDVFLPLITFDADGDVPPPPFAYRTRHGGFRAPHGAMSRFRKLQHNANFAAGSTLGAPTIRVICACRVNSIHFNLLTGIEPPQQQPPPPDQPTPIPVKEGEPFHGFTAIDLRTREIKRLQDPELGLGNVVQTPFADRVGILIALEVHSLIPKRAGVPLPA